MTEDAFSEYVEHRSGVEMQQLLHHGHWIPVLRGYTAAHVAEHFPGWSWNDLLAVCKTAGIVVEVAAGAPLCCDPDVSALHFIDAQKFAVEWNDGTVTVSDENGAGR